MSGLLVHSHGNLEGWHAIDMPPLVAADSLCPCCQHSLQAVYSIANHNNTMHVVCCDYCGYIGYDQLPEPEWLDNYYAGDWMTGEDLTPNPSHPMAEMLARIIPTHSKILEIGCGKGACLSSLRNKGYQALAGVEQCTHRAKASAEHTGLNINSQWPAGQWDVIASYHVLEHFYNPHLFFEQAKERQTKSGCILLIVPRADWEPILGQLLFILHLHSFTTMALELLAAFHGYKKVIDASNESNVIHLYTKGEPDLSALGNGRFLKTMQKKLVTGLCLDQKVKEEMLSWRVFDTHATFNIIADPHRSLCVSSIEDNGLYFDNDQCLFVK